MIKLIPMLNPDGVINGNYRTSLAGCDLNRRWHEPSEILHPEIFNAKEMIKKFAEDVEIKYIFDLHGHSGAHNVFSFGNKIKDDEVSTKVFPYLMSKINPSFCYESCTWKMPKFKRGTARILLYNELNIKNIFTIEASYSGSTIEVLP